MNASKVAPLMALLSPHVMGRHIVYCMFFVGLAGNQIDEVSSRYLRQGSSEKDEILQVAIEGLVYPPPRLVTSGPGVPPGEPKY